jgi:hypothetical protein
MKRSRLSDFYKSDSKVGKLIPDPKLRDFVEKCTEDCELAGEFEGSMLMLEKLWPFIGIAAREIGKAFALELKEKSDASLRSAAERQGK